MPLLNYSTKISARQTVGEIQDKLASAGAGRIGIEYEAREPVAVTFTMNTEHGLRVFRLPARIDDVHEVLKQQVRATVTREQASRVGWRIIKDWVAAQIAIIETGMVSVQEVFLPYMLDRDGRSVYELMAQNRLALPPGPGRSGPE